MYANDLQKEICKKKLRVIFGDEEKVKVMPIERGAYIYNGKAIIGFYIKHMCPTKLFPNTKIRVYLKLNVEGMEDPKYPSYVSWRIQDADRAIHESISVWNMCTVLLPYLPSSNSGYFDILKSFDQNVISLAYMELYGSIIKKLMMKALMYCVNYKKIPHYDFHLQILQKDIRVAINKGKDMVEDTKKVLEEWSKKEDVPLIFNENAMLSLDESNPESFISGLKNEIQISGKKNAMSMIDKNTFFEGKWFGTYKDIENTLSNEQQEPLKDSEKDPFLV